MPPPPRWRPSSAPSRAMRKNREHMLRVIRNHRRAAYGETAGYEQLAVAPVPLDAAHCPDQTLVQHAKLAWDQALALGEQHGYRNAQATVIAPTGTIGLVMDCDTTGIEPDFALVKFKKLAGGGYFKIINRAVPEALAHARLQRGRDRRDRGLCRRPRQSRAGAGHQPLDAEGQGLHQRRDRAGREGAADRLRHQVRLQQVDARRAILPRRAVGAAGRSRQPDLRPARASRLHQARDRGRQHPCLRRDDGGRRAAPEARALRGVRLRQSVRAHRQALSLGRKPHPHDGGGAALHLGRDLQDHQHAERGDRRGLQERLHALLEAGAEGQRALSRRLQALASRSTRS